MRYWDFIPLSLDQAYIEKISDIYDVDYYDAEVDSNYRATNQLIEYILSEAVNRLKISEEAKDILYESIYCNSLDSWFDLSDEDVDNTDLINEEKEIIKKFLSL
jgi:hypothetical protein